MVSPAYLVGYKSELVKLGVIATLIACLDHHDHKVVSGVLLAISRCAQDGTSFLITVEGQVAITKVPHAKGISRFVELLSSNEPSVCRSAAYAIATAAQNRNHMIT